MSITLANEISCPHCKAKEMHPTKNLPLIRAYKVAYKDGSCASQCLVCAGAYDRELNETPQNYNSGKGWFRN